MVDAITFVGLVHSIRVQRHVERNNVRNRDVAEIGKDLVVGEEDSGRHGHCHVGTYRMKKRVKQGEGVREVEWGEINHKSSIVENIQKIKESNKSCERLQYRIKYREQRMLGVSSYDDVPDIPTELLGEFSFNCDSCSYVSYACPVGSGSLYERKKRSRESGGGPVLPWTRLVNESTREHPTAPEIKSMPNARGPRKE